jgi:hypothetical protein
MPDLIGHPNSTSGEKQKVSVCGKVVWIPAFAGMTLGY